MLALGCRGGKRITIIYPWQQAVLPQVDCSYSRNAMLHKGVDRSAPSVAARFSLCVCNSCVNAILHPVDLLQHLSLLQVPICKIGRLQLFSKRGVTGQPLELQHVSARNSEILNYLQSDEQQRGSRIERTRHGMPRPPAQPCFEPGRRLPQHPRVTHHTHAPSPCSHLARHPPQRVLRLCTSPSLLRSSTSPPQHVCTPRQACTCAQAHAQA